MAGPLAGNSSDEGEPLKIKLDIDCTPEEARAFLGLPDLAGIQNEMLEKFRDRMTANLKYADPQEMFKLWFGTLGTGLRPPARANRDAD